MSAEAQLTRKRALAVLRHGPFRRYITGSAISDTGSWMQVMAQGYVMSTLTTSALRLGIANLCAGLPMLMLTMIGGSTADRFDKRKILLVTQFAQIALALGLGWLVYTHAIQIWHVYVFAALLGISNSFEMPTLSAFVPELVERDEMQNAIALDRSVFHGSRIAGPSLGGIIIALFGTAWAFFLNAFSFVALIIALMTVPPRRRGTAEEEQKRTGGFKDGFRYVIHDRPSLAMVMTIANQALFIFPIITVMMPLYVRLQLHLGANYLGYLMGASAVGSFVGSLFLLGLPRARRVPVMMGCVSAIVVAICGLAFSPTFYLAMALMVLNSLGLAMNFGLASTIVQERAPDHLRGRVSAVFMLAFVGVMPLAGLGVTSLSDAIGMPRALAIAAVAFGVIGLVVLTRVRRECAQPGDCEVTAAQTPPPPTVAAPA
ncbi:MAG: MFS transporter [Verrucomicrobiota bacterium]|nr:MFS transporter [Verrucomicrobiota bacterium]